jgi:hypothetical protein
MKQANSDDEVLAAVRQHGKRKAAEVLGVKLRGLEQRLKRLALRGYAPEHDMTRTVPEGFTVKGVSTLYNAEGQVAAQWVKSRQDEAQVRAMLEAAMAAMVADLPRLPPRKATGKYNQQVMACYPLGDPHVGMKAWAAECGQDWDLAIAERIHCGVMADLVSRAPASEWATIVNLGDLFHYDSMAAVTPRSGHNLDADGRYAKMIEVGIKIMRQCIESALGHHKFVRVVNAIGNHDETGALWLSQALAMVYEREPRVIVDRSPSVFNYVEFGKVLIGVHHGHTCKKEKLPGVMAADRPEAWGRTKHRYWWTGHIHHQSFMEYPGVSVESFNTLAVADAYAATNGYRSREQAKCIVIHSELGEVARLTSHPAMLEAA